MQGADGGFHLRPSGLAAGNLVNDTYAGFMAPMLPLLMQRQGFSIATAGMRESVFMFSTSFLQPFYGFLNDKPGQRAIVYLGPTVTARFARLSGYPPSLPMLAVILLLAGCATGAFLPTGAASTTRLVGERSGFNISVFLTAGDFGHSLGPLIIVPAVAALDFERLPPIALPAVAVSAFPLFLAPPFEKCPWRRQKISHRLPGKKYSTCHFV